MALFTLFHGLASVRQGVLCKFMLVSKRKMPQQITSSVDSEMVKLRGDTVSDPWNRGQWQVRSDVIGTGHVVASILVAWHENHSILMTPWEASSTRPTRLADPPLLRPRRWTRPFPLLSLKSLVR